MVIQTGEGLSVVVVICANGMGHFIRQIGIWTGVLKRLPLLKVTFMVTEEQLLFQSSALTVLKSLPNVKFITGVTAPGVQLRKDGIYNEDLIDWSKRLLDQEAFWRSDLIVSDNLTEPLDFAADRVVMCGQFVWADTFAGFTDPFAQAFARAERGRIEFFRPRWLGVNLLTSQTIKEQADFVGVNWIIQEEIPEDQPPEVRANNVAVFGGGTSMADAELALAVELLLADGRWNVHSAENLVTLLPANLRENSHLHLLPKGLADYSRFRAVVGRPGAGTCAACQVGRVALGCLYETGSEELAYNAATFQREGLGLDLGNNPYKVMPAVERLALTEYDIFKSRVNAQPLDGLRQTVDYFVNLLTA